MKMISSGGFLQSPDKCRLRNFVSEGGDAGSGGAGGLSARGLVLAIETSCDETAAAVVERGRRTLSNVVSSQVAIHERYGGVVPELASREHLRNIVPVVHAALKEAAVSFADLDAVAVTEGPGLAGALLVGISYAKALSFALGKPLVAVNHLEGHIHAVLLEQQERALRDCGAPAALPSRFEGETRLDIKSLALVVSGGHTHLYQVCRKGAHFDYSNIGRTLDDAAGEAFDKVAKLLGLGYPGGPWIDALAPHGDPAAVPFSLAQIKSKPHRRGDEEPEGPSGHRQDFLFSFSGIKTAVLRYVQLHAMEPAIRLRREALAAISQPRLSDVLPLCDAQTLDLIASFQRTVINDLKRKTFAAARAIGAECILVSGGVAANRELRASFTHEADARALAIAFPSPALSTDNAAMIAAAAWPKLIAAQLAHPSLTARPSLSL